MRFRDFKEEWHPTMNLPLVFDFSLPKYRKYIWICNQDHIWEASLAGRNRGKNCPLCLDINSHKTLLGLVSFGVKEWVLSNPTIAAQWHPTDNAGTRLHDVTDPSWLACWICFEGHEWESTIANRMSGKGCPICESMTRLANFGENATPDIISEWHPTKNGKLYASKVAEKLAGNIWWMCPEGHEWESSIERRANTGCKVCSGEILVIGVNDLMTTHPYIAGEWHPTKNSHGVEYITANSDQKYWWKEACGTETRETPRDRTRNYSGCGLCTTRKIIASEWHPVKNEQLVLDSIASGSEIELWCMCNAGHEWQMNLSVRSRKGCETGCNICFNQAIFVREWHPTLNGDLSAETASLEPTKKYWWLCSEGHEWEMSPKHRTSTRTGNITSCPVCFGEKTTRVNHTSLAIEKPALAAEWHPIKNGSLRPEHVSPYSDKKVWWFRTECGHEWEAFIKNRANGYGCSVCYGYPARNASTSLSVDNPELAADWHPVKNDNLTANMVRAGSIKKVWWLGNQCGHEWKASINVRHMFKTGCPVCANKKVLAGFNDLATINPNLAAQWHPTKNGEIRPEHILAGSTKNWWWLGYCGHEWEASPAYRKHSKKCPRCRYLNSQAVIFGLNDLLTVNPTIAAEWHPTKNGNRTADRTHADSGSKIWWLGLSCSHAWAASPALRAIGATCPLCKV